MRRFVLRLGSTNFGPFGQLLKGTDISWRISSLFNECLCIDGSEERLTYGRGEWRPVGKSDACTTTDADVCNGPHGVAASLAAAPSTAASINTFELEWACPEPRLTNAAVRFAAPPPLPQANRYLLVVPDSLDLYLVSERRLIFKWVLICEPRLCFLSFYWIFRWSSQTSPWFTGFYWIPWNFAIFSLFSSRFTCFRCLSDFGRPNLVLLDFPRLLRLKLVLNHLEWRKWLAL